MTWPPNGPVTAHRYRAAIARSAPDPNYPWDVSIDYVDPATGRRDTNLDSLDYGSFATHADAIAFACSVLSWIDDNP